MNRSLLSRLALLSLCGASLLPLARADDPSTPPPTPPSDTPPPPPEGGAPHGRSRIGPRLEELAKQLNLTPEQKKRIGDIIKVGFAQAKAARDNDDLSPEEKRSKMHEIRTSVHNQIRAVLTPDQQKQFDAITARPPSLPPQSQKD